MKTEIMIGCNSIRIRPQSLLLAGYAACSMLLSGCGGGAAASAADAGGAPSAVTPASGPAAVPGNWWKPVASDRLQLQLRGTVNSSYAVEIYDVDMFDNSGSTLSQLKSGGRKVVCYFSAGSSENWRPDFSQFTAADMGRALVGWPGENWLDTRSANVRGIMKARMDLARSKGCDGVDPDNVDGYTNNTGFPLTAQDQLDYNQFLAIEAHKRGLAVALKNDIGQLSELEPWFDLAVNEQCYEFSECGGYSAFTSRNKPVLNVEYADKYKNNTAGARDALCASSRTANLRTLVLPRELDDAFRFSCDH